MYFTIYMMVTTHVLVGVLLGAITSPLVAIEGLILASAAGGFFPDLDMLGIHRKTLHRPFQYAIAGLLFGVLGYFSSYFLLFAIFLLSASIHSFSDIICNGKTMRPWSSTDDRAVFNHLTQEWIHPKRLFYDGSSTDLAIALVLSSIIAGMYGASLGLWMLVSISIAYSLGRRRITEALSGYEKFSDVFINVRQKFWTTIIEK